MIAIYKRELRAYFTSMHIYIWHCLWDSPGYTLQY